MSDVQKKSETVKVEVSNNIIKSKGFDSSNLSKELMSDAFFALSMAILDEMFMSSDTKVLLFYGMIGRLEKKYPPDVIEDFRVRLNEAIKNNIKTNSFMG